MLTLVINNDIDEISRLAPFIEEVADAYSIAPDVAFKVNLALDEALANSISYAYPEGTEGSICLEAEMEKREDKAEGGELVFRIIDQGVAFDPTQEGEVDTTLSVEERPIGGLGIFLIKQMMDSVTYCRIDDKNILTLRKTV